MHNSQQALEQDKQRRFAREVLGKYALLQLPGIGVVVIIMLILQHVFELPGWSPWLVLLIWVIKDATLYPFVWRAYDSKRSSHLHSLVGREAIAKQDLQPTGYVVIDGVLWRASTTRGEKIAAQQRVRVSKVQGLTLIVQSNSSSTTPPEPT